jgi:ABC-type proline/glycine betaine transport system permease subunit
MMPPELQAYLAMDASVLNVATTFSDVPFWVARVIIAIGVVAAIGLCFGKPWGRTLYLLTFLASLITTFLWEYFVSTALSVVVSYVATITEGMILGLAYFSHIRRIFEPSEEGS